MGQFSKPWDELTIADNFIFCKVMENERICMGVLETLLGISVGHIEYLKTENSLENFYDSRGIRLDVYVKDADRIFNIEMQTGNYDDMLLRARYYLSSSDVATTKRRTKFKDIRETYILFICKDDPFGEGIPRYTKISKFLETDRISYDDKSRNVFYNCSAWEKEGNPEVRGVLKFIYGLKPDSSLALEMDEAASLAKQKSELEDEYMYFSDILEDEKEEAREIGLAEGRAKGLKEGLAEGRAKGFAEGHAEGHAEGLETGRHQQKIESAKTAISLGLSEQQVVAISGLSPEEIRKLIVN
nr:Rpn family recombination-promoting nuclease/putative transposase [uncultured Treponema sp.]